MYKELVKGLLKEGTSANMTTGFSMDYGLLFLVAMCMYKYYYCREEMKEIVVRQEII